MVDGRYENPSDWELILSLNGIKQELVEEELDSYGKKGMSCLFSPRVGSISTIVLLLLLPSTRMEGSSCILILNFDVNTCYINTFQLLQGTPCRNEFGEVHYGEGYTCVLTA